MIGEMLTNGWFHHKMCYRLRIWKWQKKKKNKKLIYNFQNEFLEEEKQYYSLINSNRSSLKLLKIQLLQIKMKQINSQIYFRTDADNFFFIFATSSWVLKVQKWFLFKRIADAAVASFLKLTLSNCFQWLII